MENVTLSLDDEVARWAQSRAKEIGKSLAQFLEQLLRDQAREDEVYKAAMERYFSLQPTRISETGEYPRREEIYDRPIFRR
jgi:negative regulator of replication initiation